MSFQWIHDQYGKTFFKGQRCTALGKPGVVTKATNHIFVKLEGAKNDLPYHPDDVEAA